MAKNSNRSRNFAPWKFWGAIFFSAIFASGIFVWFSVDVNVNQVVNINGSSALYDREGRLFHVRLSPDSEWQIPIKLDEMGKWLPLVAVNAEDGRFFRHIGIDLLSLSRAIFQDAISGRVISGASTITSQVIRLAVSERENRKRTPSTKVREFVMAMKLERKISKEKILECYLNLAPFGGNIRGVQAASLIYFGKPASKISRGEACLLIGMLKGPTLYRPDTKPIAAKKRRDEIINLMRKKRVFTPEETRLALLEELPVRKNDLPSRAWHFSDMVLSSNPDFDDTYFHQRIFHTSLNLETQTKLEGILRQSLSDFPNEVTISAGVVDNRDASLVAWVGNARFNLNNTQNASSWVDCGRAPRSPGSTLKPFAYLLAIEQGILTPSSLLADTSMAFSGRAPRNFDLKYHGAVTARVALAESLNAPAVRVLRMSGNDRVLSLMRSLGLKHLTQNSEYYGDSLILGGCEVTLFEELEAFCGLASLGKYRQISLLKDQDSHSDWDSDSRFASEASCWLVNDILNHRGNLTLFARGTLGRKWQVALKTGTSYGLRDAWTAAWTPDYTTVVWVGSPEGISWRGLVGARAAAPIAMKILRVISPKSTWYERPEGLELRRVCSVSGMPPTAACPSVKYEWAIAGVTRTVPCDMHKIRAGKSILSLSPEFANIARNNPTSRVERRNYALKIISPIPGASYFIAPFDLERKIPLKSEGGVRRVWWYIDGEFAGSSSPDNTFFCSLQDGEHLVSAVDSAGKTASVNVKVFTPGRRVNDSENNLLF